MKVINRTCPICEGKGIIPRPLTDKVAIDKRTRIAQSLRDEGYSYGEIAKYLECSRNMAVKYTLRKIYPNALTTNKKTKK